MNKSAVVVEFPSMHQNSQSRTLTEQAVQEAQPLRRPWKVSDGGGLYLLVVPTGGRYWRYNYRFAGKQKTVALGIYPDVPLEKARERHLRARELLADGNDPFKERLALRSRPVA
jgi:hypothetical protein